MNKHGLTETRIDSLQCINTACHYLHTLTKESEEKLEQCFQRKLL